MSKKFLPGVLLTLATSGLLPFAAPAAVANGCYWVDGNAGPIRYVAHLNTQYVPKDARIGDPIGPTEQSFLLSGGGLSVHCLTDGTRITFNALSSAKPVPGPIPRMNGVAPHGTLLETNVPGVGALIKIGSPYDGMTTGFWKLNSADSTVPFDGYIDFNTPFALQHALLRGTVTLIKTGTIGQGVHPLDSGKEMVNASFTGVPNAFSLALSGSVTQAECTLSTNPVSADPVQLGDWPDTEFTGEGHATVAVPFSIALNSCISDPLPGGFEANAHIRLDPVAGSTAIDAANGVFSLGSTSSAQGVGIQILKRDAMTPIALLTDVDQGVIPASGGMLLEFNARYYQTRPTADVSAGSADASLSFTITYK